MAAPTAAELQALITQVRIQVATLTSAAATTAALTPTAIIFANTPQLLNAKDIIDYFKKMGSSIYEQGCKTLDNKALTNGFGMTSDQTAAFVEALTRCATAMGWNTGSKQFFKITNSARKNHRHLQGVRPNQQADPEDRVQTFLQGR
jgi:hypothetical protein